MFLPSACSVTTWLSVDAFHSVVLHCVITAAAVQSVLSEYMLALIPFPARNHHKNFSVDSVPCSSR